VYNFKSVTSATFTFLSILLGLIFLSLTPAKAGSITDYNIIWTEPGKDSKDSMPLGNGDIGLNVWVEENGDLQFYISKTDLWSENGRLLKLGKMRIRLTPNPFRSGQPFRQVLALEKGAIEITAGSGASAVHLLLWVDARNPVIRLEARSQTAFQVAAQLEPWRTKVDTIRDILVSDLCFFPEIYGPMIVQPDVILDDPAPRLVWYHWNRKSRGYRLNMALQGLDGFGQPDPLTARIFGAVVLGEGFTKKDHLTLVSPTRKEQHLTIHVLTQQPGTPEKWLKTIEKQIDRVNAIKWETAFRAHRKWWQDFWHRSWIYVRSTTPKDSSRTDEGLLVTRGYILQRFINACAGRGSFPIKFNGSIFTVDYPGKEGFADYRRWGPGYWWQNTRLPYMAMTAAGDFDLVQPFFKMYTDLLPLCQYRTKLYFGHEGAYYPECIYFWGGVFSKTWGPKSLKERDEPLQDSPWHKYEWVSGLEMAAMMHRYYLYTEDAKFLQETFLPFAEAVLTFFDQHYKTDANGKLVIHPAQALETWWDCTNPLPEVAGLHYLVEKIQHLPAKLVSEDFRDFLTRLKAKLPEIPVRQQNGLKMLAPAERFANKRNVENPELYAVYPFTLFRVGKPDIELAINALKYRQDRGHFGWRQDDIFMALLGLTEQARRGLVERCSQWDRQHRFPAFWGPNYDWTPDQDHGGVLTKTLQTMLMQCDEREIRLLPAWPEDWDVDFKLHAPFSTIVRGKVRKGKVVELNVTPSSREKDIIWGHQPSQVK